MTIQKIKLVSKYKTQKMNTIKINRKLNVKPKNLNVMKQKIFTLIMIVALVVIANTTFAADGDNTHPYVGTMKTYHISPITVVTNGTLTVGYDGAGETISTPRTGATAGSGELSSNIFTTSMSEIYFDITYGTDANAGDGTITVTVTDNAGTGCSNNITLAIDVILPTFTVDLGVDPAATCQTLGTAPTDGSQDAASLGYTAVQFVVTPAVGGATGYTYNFTLTMSGNTIIDESSVPYKAVATSGSLSQSGQVLTLTNVPDGATTITVYVATTEGSPTTLTGTAGATPTMAYNSNTINGTITGGTRSVLFKTMPTIGSFQ